MQASPPSGAVPPLGIIHTPFLGLHQRRHAVLLPPEGKGCSIRPLSGGCEGHVLEGAVPDHCPPPSFSAHVVAVPTLHGKHCHGGPPASPGIPPRCGDCTLAWVGLSADQLGSPSSLAPRPPACLPCTCLPGCPFCLLTWCPPHPSPHHPSSRSQRLVFGCLLCSLHALPGHLVPPGALSPS